MRSRLWTGTEWILIAICAVIPALSVLGSDYFVSPRGDDRGDGLSELTAWKTVARVNAAAFQPGDRILFERGGEWRESLQASSSGEAGKPVVYRAYGKGAKPKFWGSVVLDNSAFTLDQGTTYKITTTFGVDRHCGIAVDHVLMKWIGFADNAGRMAAMRSKPGSAIVDDGYPSVHPDHSMIYINTGGSDPRTDGKIYTACVRDNVIHSSYKNYVTFQDLVVDETAILEMGFGVRIDGGKGVRLERCEAYRVGAAHFAFVDGDASEPNVGDQLYAAYAMRNQPSIQCSAFFSRLSANVEWIDCVAKHLELNDDGATYRVLTALGTGKVLAKNMTCTGHGGGAMYFADSAKVTVKGGVFENCNVEQWSGGLVFDGVTFTGSSWMNVWSKDNTYENCLFADIAPPEGGVFFFRDKASGNTVRFCTIIPVRGACLQFGGSAPGTSWYGNVMLGTVSYGGNPNDIATADHNLYAVAQESIMGQPWSEWRAAGRDTQSIIGDPRFADPVGGNYKLEPTSPAVDAATGTPFTPKSDLALNARPNGKAADIGALESGTLAK
jgi:hypothetical protein